MAQSANVAFTSGPWRKRKSDKLGRLGIERVGLVHNAANRDPANPCSADIAASLPQFLVRNHCSNQETSCTLKRAYMPYRFRVLGLLFVLVFVMYLDRLVHRRGGTQNSARDGDQPERLGLGDWRFYTLLRAFRNTERNSGRPDRRAQGSDAHRPLVVCFYGADRSGDKLPDLLRGAFSVWRRRSRSVPQLHVGGLALGSRLRAGAGLKRVLDGDGHGRRAGAPNRGFDRTTPRMAGGLLRLRFAGRFLERDLVLVVPRFARREAGRVARGEGKDRSAGRPPPESRRPVVATDAQPNFLRLLLMYHTYCWGAYFYLSWLHTYLQLGRGFTESQMDIASALPSCGGLGRRYSRRIF